MASEVVAESKAYVLIEAVGKAAKICGYDSYLCAWDDFAELVENWSEVLETEVPATLRFTIFLWTPEEYEAYCEKNGVEIT